MQRGVAAVEFALVSILFFLIIFCLLDFARMMYMFNTLADVTRSAARSAANIDWTSEDALNRARQRAILRNSPGELPFGAPITDEHIRIDYMQLQQVGSTISLRPVPTHLMPANPARNRLNCLINPYGAAGPDTTCIRMVRVRICIPDSDCDSVRYQPMFSLIDLRVGLPTSTTLVNAETLGYRPGAPLTP